MSLIDAHKYVFFRGSSLEFIEVDIRENLGESSRTPHSGVLERVRQRPTRPAFKRGESACLENNWDAIDDILAVTETFTSEGGWRTSVQH